MLFSFTIDPSAIADTLNNGRIPLELRRKLSQFVRDTWVRYGVLYALSDPNGDGVQNLREGIRNIKDDSLKKHWSLLLAQMPNYNRLKPLKLNGWQGYQEGLQARIYHAIANEHELELVCLLQGSSESDVDFTKKPEIIEFKSFMVSDVVRKFQNLNSATLRRDSTMENMWNQRFLPYAKIAKSVTVRDLYGLNDILDVGSPVRNFLRRMVKSIEEECEIHFLVRWPTQPDKVGKTKQRYKGLLWKPTIIEKRTDKIKRAGQLLEVATKNFFGSRRQSANAGRITEITFHL